ncbi:MAG TPA: hypothetical protein VNE82_14735 [Candidatus Binataceae bacterium]|nr:hypothetical protein [Candidatus Binataceae bacterium]
MSPILPNRPSSVRHRLFWGFGAQGGAILLRIVQQLALVPILIHVWGTDLYGEWLVIFSAASSLSIVDFGLQIYFGNALLIAWSKGDAAGFRRLFSNAAFLYAVILALALLALATASAVVSWPELLATRLLSPEAAVATTFILALVTLALVPFGLVTSLYRVHGDYSRGTVVSITAEALRGLGICAVVWFGGSPLAASFVSLLVAALFWAGVLLDLRRRYGPLPLGMTAPTPAELRTTVTRSAMYLASTVVTPVIVNAPVLLLGTLLAVPAAVVAYTTARTFTGLVRQVVNQFCHLIGVEMTRQLAAGDRARVIRIYAGAGRLIGGMAGLLGGFTLIAAPAFLRIWTRGQVPFDPWLIGAFVATVILTAPAYVGQMLYTYNNKPGILVAAQGGYAAATVVFCLLLIRGYGAAGAAIGTGVAELLTVGLLMPYAAAKEIASPLRGFFLRSYAAAGAAFLLGYGVGWALDAALVAATLLGLVALAVLWSAVVAMPAFFLVLDPQERHWLREAAVRYASRLRIAVGT